jgi:hypothetical protein
MITPEQHQKELLKQRRKYESILIDIMFGLIDMESLMDESAFPLEDIEKKIDELKYNIGRELKD